MLPPWPPGFRLPGREPGCSLRGPQVFATLGLRLQLIPQSLNFAVIFKQMVTLLVQDLVYLVHPVSAKAEPKTNVVHVGCARLLRQEDGRQVGGWFVQAGSHRAAPDDYGSEIQSCPDEDDREKYQKRAHSTIVPEAVAYSGRCSPVGVGRGSP